MEALTQSIAEMGFALDHPVIVVEREGRKKLLDGFHRVTAAKEVVKRQVRK
jgi:ParB-like chromosome segregation protein Spo0J